MCNCYLSGSHIWKNKNQFLKKGNRIAIWPNNSTRCTSKGFENLCPHKVLDTNDHSSFIHSSPKAEATQMATNSWTNKQNVVYSHVINLFSQKECNTCMRKCGWTLETCSVQEAWKEAIYKEQHIVCLLLHEMSKVAKSIKSRLVIARSWGWGYGKWLLKGMGFFWGVMKKFRDEHCGNGCTILWLLKSTQLYNFGGWILGCEFYLDRNTYIQIKRNWWY